MPRADEAGDTGAAANVRDEGLVARRVELAPAVVLSGVERPEEVAGLVTARLELGLSDLDGTLPRVQGVPLSPGLEYALREGWEAWTGTVDVRPEAFGMVVSVVLCPVEGPDAACVSGEGPATTIGDVHLGVGAALTQVAIGWGAPVSPTVREAWADPETADEYRSLIAGRAAAAFYGLRAEGPGDWLTRALAVDARMPAINWLAARRAAVAGDPEQAARLLQYAGQDRSISPLLAADRVAAWLAAGRPALAAEAAAQLVGADDQDPRWVVLRARAALYSGDPSAARTMLDRIAEKHGRDATIARLRYEVAEATGRTEELEGLLLAWGRAAPGEAEPLRRLVRFLVEKNRFDEALALVAPLADAGAEAEARRIGTALAVALGRLEDARARAVGDSLLQARIESRISGTAAPGVDADGDPYAWLLVGRAALRRGDAATALSRADAVLRSEPWFPEALRLRSDALEALGRADAAAARDLAAWVDPR